MSTTLAAFEREAYLAPRATALVDSATRATYSALAARAHAAAEVLRAHDVHTLALLADNSIDWIVADLAAQIAGVVLVPIPAFFSQQQRQHAIEDCGADAILTDQPFGSDTTPLAPTPLGQMTPRLRLYRCTHGARDVDLPSGTAKISYTSGTTGTPKGACLPQSAMDSVAESLCSVTAELSLTRHLCALPLALLLENIAGIYGPLRAGMQIAVPSLAELGWAGSTGFDARVLLCAIDRYRPDSLILVPQMLSDIVHALADGAELPRGLKFVAVGGGHVAPSLLEKAIGYGLPVYEGYGLTESASVVALTSPNQRRRGSVGRPLAHTRVRISTSNEIMVSGASFLGYVGQPSAAAAEIATGDLGRLDEDGYLYVSGRKKSVYITSFGRNVSPEWVEAELVGEPSIAQAAVFGDARPWSIAVVVIAPGASRADVDAGIARVNARLPDYGRIGNWRAATEPFLPTNGQATSNGRNRRREIWNRYAGDINAQYDVLIAESKRA